MLGNAIKADRAYIEMIQSVLKQTVKNWRNMITRYHGSTKIAFQRNVQRTKSYKSFRIGKIKNKGKINRLPARWPPVTVLLER